MKKISILILFIFIIIAPSLVMTSFADDNPYKGWGNYGSEPVLILDQVVDKANKDYQIQETALDGVTDLQGAYASEYKISNTLTYIRIRIYPYLQRFVYIGLTLATILLIYNGFLLVTNVAHKQGEIATIKKNLMYIAIGVLLMTGFYFIIKLIIAILTSIFGDFSGSSGF